MDNKPRKITLHFNINAHTRSDVESDQIIYHSTFILRSHDFLQVKRKASLLQEKSSDQSTNNLANKIQALKATWKPKAGIKFKVSGKAAVY